MLPRPWAHAAGDFRRDPRRDFGGIVVRTPARVLQPTTVAELAACMRALRESRTPYKLRAAAHSASGEVLTAGGAVVDLSALTGITADDPDAETITALGGTTWLAVWEHLATSGRRPLTLTTNPRTTLGGTLGAGGVGDASHRRGPQVAGVRELVLVTPDGERHTARPGDPYFALALCGHGALGAIAEVTLGTVREASTLTGRVLRWSHLDRFLGDAVALGDACSHIRARLVWADGLTRVWAIVGTPGEVERALPIDAAQLLGASAVETVDLLAHARIDPAPAWARYNQCVELVLPVPAGIPALHAIDAAIARGPLARYLPRGASLALVAGTPELPLSPFRTAMNVVLAIRPEPPDLAQARLCEPALRELATLALGAGGRIYLASFGLDAAQRAIQLGEAEAELAAAKRAVDPDGLCNRGNLHGWEPAPPASTVYSPRMSQRLASFDELVAFLVAQAIPHQVDAANQVVNLATRAPTPPFPLVIRWERAIPFIQIIQQITPEVPDARVRELEAALARINDVAMIPGYGFSYATKVLYYRLATPIFDGGIASDMLDRSTAAVMNNAAQMAAALQAVIGGAPGAQVLETLASNAITH